MTRVLPESDPNAPIASPEDRSATEAADARNRAAIDRLKRHAPLRRAAMTLDAAGGMPGSGAKTFAQLAAMTADDEGPPEVVARLGYPK